MRSLTSWTYVLTTLTAVAFLATDAHAANLAWNAAGGGKADDVPNWTPSQLPGLADDLTFGLSNAYTVTWDGTISKVDTIDVSAGDVIFQDLGTADLTTTGRFEVGDNSGNQATLRLNGGVWTSGSSLRVGFNAADDGRLELDDAKLNALSSLSVGFRGDGELILVKGTLDVTGNLNAASATSGTTNGTALVEVGGTLDVSGTTNLGAAAGGTATLRVDGGDYTSGGATTINAGSLLEILDGPFDADSSLTLASATSTLTLNGGDLNANAGLDNSAAGTLNLFDGTLTVTGGAFQPNAGGPTDDYEIDGPSAAEMPHLVLGAGATANIGRHLTVGDVNHGTLTVGNGATVSNLLGVIGDSSGSTGAVTVDGASSTWTNSITLTVGDAGSGTLTIQNGGTVSNGTGSIGQFFGSTGTVTVDGAGSTWTNLGVLQVGTLGNGTLTVTNGATVSAGSAGLIGTAFVASPGTVTVDGAGSTLTITNSLLVGLNSSASVVNGSLTVKNNGVVDVTGLTRISNTGSLTIEGGTFNASDVIDIDGGTLQVDDTLNLLGGATLINQNGGTVSGAGNVELGGTTFDNSAIVSPGSSAGILTLSGGSYTQSATGTLAIEIGGTVQGTDFDILLVEGAATLDGMLDVSLINGFTLGAAQEFEILSAGALSGTFAGLAEGALVGNFGGTDLFVSYVGGDGNDVSLFTTLAGLSGDFDGDDDVDGADFLKWQRDPGVGNLSDWQTNYGNTALLTAASTAVPEPSTLLLSAMASLLGFSFRRNR